METQADRKRTPSESSHRKHPTKPAADEKCKQAPQTEKEGSAKTAEIEEGRGGLDQTIKQEVEELCRKQFIQIIEELAIDKKTKNDLAGEPPGQTLVHVSAQGSS